MGACHMQCVQLQQKICTSEDKLQRAEASEQRLKDRVSQLEHSLEVTFQCHAAPECDSTLLIIMSV
jgi:hypothetical protein